MILAILDIPVIKVSLQAQLASWMLLYLSFLLLHAPQNVVYLLTFNNRFVIVVIFDHKLNLTVICHHSATRMHAG